MLYFLNQNTGHFYATEVQSDFIIWRDVLLLRRRMNDSVAQWFLWSPPFPKGGSGGILCDRGRLKSPLAPL